MILFALASMSTALAEPCAAPTTKGEVEVHLNAAMGAFEALDLNAFRDSADAAFARVDCLKQPLTPPMAARLHRLAGLQAFSDQDFDLAEGYFAASRTIEPSFRFPDSMFAADHPVQQRLTAVSLESVESVSFKQPKVGRILIDGAYGQSWRKSLPTLYQQADDKGLVVKSALLAPGASFPNLVNVDGVPLPGGKSTGSGKTLLTAGSVTAGVGVGLLAASLALGPNRMSVGSTENDAYSQGHANLKRGLGVSGIAVTATGTALITGALLKGNF